MKHLLLPLLLLIAACTPEEASPPHNVDPRILYGSPDNSQAHQAVIYIAKDEGGGYMSACTGTLITNTVVLTAAHCIGPAHTMTVYFGNSINTFYDMREVVDAQTHPYYSGTPTDIRNDIALIRLTQPAPSSVVPIPFLPASLGMSTADEYNTQLQYVGFGLTHTGSSGSKLTITRPPIRVCTGSSDCYVSLGNLGTTVIAPGVMAIAMDSADGGICSGDSGGPAFVWRNGTEYVAGVSSFVLQDQQGQCNYMGASTIVSSFEPFINDFLGIPSEICTNGTDDDGDGQADCADPDCAAHPSCDTQEEEICTNGVDDDRDNRVDCADPDCATHPHCTTQEEEICTNGTDDDGDGLVDCADDDCAAHSSCNTPGSENCTNGTDDDGDGLMDCADADCLSTAWCQSQTEVCGNGVDDDGDFLADCDDKDCQEPDICGVVGEHCHNLLDDDGDGKIDCNDPDCVTFSQCRPLIENCTNGVDDDGDLLADCADADCQTHHSCPPPSGENCSNSVDDDNDGQTDCADKDCLSSSRCALANLLFGDEGEEEDPSGCTCTSGSRSSAPLSPLLGLLLLLGLALRRGA